MPNHNRAPDAKLCKRARDKFSLTRRRCIVIGLGSRTPAVARAIDKDDTMRHGKPFAKREPHVLQISTRAVNKNESRFRIGVIGRKPKHDHMQAHAMHVDELSRRRVLSFQARAPRF